MRNWLDFISDNLVTLTLHDPDYKDRVFKITKDSNIFSLDEFSVRGVLAGWLHTMQPTMNFERLEDALEEIELRIYTSTPIEREGH